MCDWYFSINIDKFVQKEAIFVILYFNLRVRDPNILDFFFYSTKENGLLVNNQYYLFTYSSFMCVYIYIAYDINKTE